MDTRTDARAATRAREALLARHFVAPTTAPTPEASLGLAGIGGLGGGMGFVSPETAALSTLERDFATFDDPGGGDGDGIVSEGDLEKIARGDYDRDAARARIEARGEDADAELARIEETAQFFLGDGREVFDAMDTANGRGGNDAKVSRSDLFAYRAQRAAELDFEIPDRPVPEQTFEVPTDDDGLVETDETNRTVPVALEQQQAIVEAIATGEPVAFTNTEGDTQMLRVEQLGGNGEDSVGFELTTEDGTRYRIDSELSVTDTHEAIARIADGITQVPVHLRGSVDKFRLVAEEDPDGALASYGRSKSGWNPFGSTEGRITFYGGVANITESTFDHELAHGIGDGLPDGWEDAIAADGEAPSDYAKESSREDFAEFWPAYVEARQHGEEALAALEAAYPNRFAISEVIYGGA